MTAGAPPNPPSVAALVTDLMDRSRLSAAVPGVTFALTDDPDVVVIDLAKRADQVAAVRRALPRARIVCYGAHVDDEAMAAARADGADVVLARSRFFRDPAAAIAATG